MYLANVVKSKHDSLSHIKYNRNYDQIYNITFLMEKRAEGARQHE